VQNYPEIRSDDSVVLFGSQVSNLKTRMMLGNPWQEEPILYARGEDNDWNSALWWNLHTPGSARRIKRRQYDTDWIAQNHIIVGSRGDIYKPKLEAGRLVDDYLLITVLPRFKSGYQRVIILGGVHGPGTLAASNVLSQPPMGEIEKLVKKTSKEPYYQALFHVEVAEGTSGELSPKTLSLVDARALQVAYASGDYESV
jgi:hypothetical protein